MEKLTRPSTRKSKKYNEQIGVPKGIFYPAILGIFAYITGFVINTNVRLSALENDNETNKIERREIRDKMDTILSKLTTIEISLVQKADKRYND